MAIKVRVRFARQICKAFHAYCSQTTIFVAVLGQCKVDSKQYRVLVKALDFAHTRSRI